VVGNSKPKDAGLQVEGPGGANHNPRWGDSAHDGVAHRFGLLVGSWRMVFNRRPVNAE
jgi:hypothetical protein